MLEYSFSKGFVVLERNSNNLKMIANESKQRIHAMDMHYSDCVMNFTTAITSISNTFKQLFLQLNLYSSCIQNIYTGKEENINNIFSTYVEPLLNYINHPTLVQVWKLNCDAPAYEK